MKKIMALIALATTLVAETLTLSGTVISDNQKMITSRFMGFVTSVNVSEGDRVRRGQVLYTIDSREIDSAKRQAEAGLQMSKNQYANVEINLARYKTLYAKDMVAKYEVENLELAAKNLQDM
ncbi:MAG: biotin/lipoyl-binding protein, partial [Sulfurimonas sp.]